MEIKDLKEFFGDEWNDLIDSSFKKVVNLIELSLYERFVKILLSLAEGLKESNSNKIMESIVALALSEEDVAKSVDITHMFPLLKEEVEDGKIMVHNIEYEDIDNFSGPNS